jgi:lysophospholipase L1-like esterase
VTGGGAPTRSLIVVYARRLDHGGHTGLGPLRRGQAREGAIDPESQWQHWAARADPGLEFRNRGVNRERTDQIAARLDTCVDGADALVVQGGINDIVQGRRVEDAAADIRAMVRAGKALGLRVAVANVLPWKNGPREAAEQIRHLNRLVADAAAHESVPLRTRPYHRGQQKRLAFQPRRGSGAGSTPRRRLPTATAGALTRRTSGVSRVQSMMLTPP